MVKFICCLLNTFMYDRNNSLLTLQIKSTMNILAVLQSISLLL